MIDGNIDRCARSTVTIKILDLTNETDYFCVSVDNMDFDDHYCYTLQEAREEAEYWKDQYEEWGITAIIILQKNARMTNICINCHHCKASHSLLQAVFTGAKRVWLCHHPNVANTRHDIIEGTLINHNPIPCAVARQPGAFCGPRGDLYTANL